MVVEVSFSRFGERGSIDVLAFHPGRRALAVFEIKSVAPDMQAMLSAIDRKARLGPVIARERGWDARTVARLLVVADTRTNRRCLEAHAATVRAMLPAGSRDVVRWLADPVAPGMAGVWFLSDVRREDRMVARRHRVRLRRGGGRSGGDGGSGNGPVGGPWTERPDKRSLDGHLPGPKAAWVRTVRPWTFAEVEGGDRAAARPAGPRHPLR